MEITTAAYTEMPLFESSAAQTAPWAKLRSSVNKLRQAQIAVWETVGLLFHKEGLK